jgi:hypothetical protein
MNGFFIKDKNGSRLELQLLTTEKEIVLSIESFGETAKINITSSEDLNELQDRIRSLTWNLEDLNKPILEPTPASTTEESEVGNG